MKYLIILLLLATFISCETKMDEDTECTEYKRAAIIETKLPQQGVINEPIIFDVTYAVINGCGFFSAYKETMEVDTLYVEMEAEYKGCICTQNIPVYDQPYTYTPKYLGLNYIRFLSTFDQSFLETIEVF